MVTCIQYRMQKRKFKVEKWVTTYDHRRITHMQSGKHLDQSDLIRWEQTSTMHSLVACTIASTSRAHRGMKLKELMSNHHSTVASRKKEVNLNRADLEWKEKEYVSEYSRLRVPVLIFRSLVTSLPDSCKVIWERAGGYVETTQSSRRLETHWQLFSKNDTRERRK